MNHLNLYYLFTIVTVSKNGSILLSIWYLVNLLGLVDFFGGNGSTSDNCLLLNSLGSLGKNGNSDNSLILLFSFLFLYYFLFHYYKRGDFLINLYFYSARPVFLYYAQKIILKI